VGRWLTADARDVVAVVPRRSPQAHAPSGGLATSVERWRHAFARTRSLVVLRRALLCAVALAAVLLAAGGPTGVVVGAPLVAGVAVALWAAARSRVDSARAAWLLDRRLGLREQVGTAWELRDDAAVLVAADAVSTSELGWNGTSRSLPVRFDAARPPFADSRLHLRVDLTDESGETQYHSLDDAAVFVVYPADDSRGLVRVEGRWSPAAELERA
jgi:hypothetical protein